MPPGMSEIVATVLSNLENAAAEKVAAVARYNGVVKSARALLDIEGLVPADDAAKLLAALPKPRGPKTANAEGETPEGTEEGTETAPSK